MFRLLGTTNRLLALAGILVMFLGGGISPSTASAGSASYAGARSPITGALSPVPASGIAADSLYSISIVVSANVTQDEPATITVSGEAEAARRLFVYASAAGVCASEPVSDTGEVLSSIGGEEITEGGFEKTYEYTPESVGTYTVCAYVDESEAAVPDITGKEVFEAARPTGSALVQVSASPTQDEPVTITVSGETEVARKLFVYIDDAGHGCEPEPADESGGAWLSNPGGEEIGAGSFKVAYNYMPATVAVYTVCVYVDEAEAAVPDATAEESFEAARPTGSAAVEVSANPTRAKPVTITVSGETEVARKLFVYIDDAGHGCEPEPAGESGGAWLSTSGGEVIGAGSFKVAYNYTPASVAVYTVCVYVDEAEAAVPDATAEESFEVVRPTDVSIQVSADSTRNEPVTITVSGESEMVRKLFVYISSAGNGCELTPEAEREAGREELSREGGETLAAGSFKHSYDFTPEFVGIYTVCAFVDESATALPTASSAASFASSLSQAEVEERLAQAEAEEKRLNAVHEAEVRAAREAATKAAQEAAAKAALEASVAAAREAAARTAQESAAKAAKERAEGELAAAIAAKLKAARGRPVTRLSVSAVAHDGPSLAHPGYTSLQVTTSPFAFVTVRLTHNGHRTTRREWGEQPSAVAAEVSWSCQHPGGTYLYTVTAWTGVGRKLSKTGRFAPVSATRCRELEKQEASTGAQRRAQAKQREAREYEEELERRQRAEDEERERQESTCRAEGGTPTILIGPEGTTWVCEAPSGGTLPTA